MKAKNFLMAFCLTVLNLSLIAQETEKEEFKPTFKLSGFSHIWAGYGITEADQPQYGMAVRYMRFKATGSLTPTVKWLAQYSFDKGNPSIVDVAINYEPFDFLKVQFGQFAVPGLKSGAMTCNLWSTTKQVFNDRPTITQHWGSNAGLSGYRNLGAMIYGNVLNDIINYYLMVGSSKAGTSNYFNANVKGSGYSHNESGLAVFSRLEIKPIQAMAIGINYHMGKGEEANNVVNKRSGFSSYFLANFSGIRIMAETVAGHNNTEDDGTETSDFIYSGTYLEGSYRIAKTIEPALRFDIYTPVVDGNDANGYEKYNNLTIGCNYYPDKNIALMFNFVIRGEKPIAGMSEMDNNLAYFQLRYKFSSK